MRREKGNDEQLADIIDLSTLDAGVIAERLRNRIEEAKLVAIHITRPEPGVQYPSLDTARD